MNLASWIVLGILLLVVGLAIKATFFAKKPSCAGCASCSAASTVGCASCSAASAVGCAGCSLAAATCANISAAVAACANISDDSDIANHELETLQ